MRRRFIQDPRTGDLVPAEEFVLESAAPAVIPDTPGYVSPVTGLWVEGRVQRREDMKRTGSRPWEGMDQEKKEAARQREYGDRASDARLHDAAARAFYGMPEATRRMFEQ